jgi:hypothetical protein
VLASRGQRLLYSPHSATQKETAEKHKPFSI